MLTFEMDDRKGCIGGLRLDHLVPSLGTYLRVGARTVP